MDNNIMLTHVKNQKDVMERIFLLATLKETEYSERATP